MSSAAGEKARAKILRCATAAFAADGFDGVGLRQIGRAAGMANSSLLHHYPNKELLYRAVLEQTAGTMDDVEKRVTSVDGSLSDVGSELFDAWLHWCQSHRTHMALVARELVDGSRRIDRIRHFHFAGVFKRLSGAFQRASHDRLSEADAGMIVLHIIGSVTFFMTSLPTTARLLPGGRRKLVERFRISTRAQVVAGLNGL